MSPRRTAARPLPLRDGIDPTRVVLRAAGTVEQSLLLSPVLAGVTGAELWERATAGELVDGHGRPVDVTRQARPGEPIWLYRDIAPEPPVPAGLTILHQDENLVVVDKPHFMATMPRGAHVVNTALVQLRRQTGNAALSPVHRLDRLTAGVLLFTARPQARAAYQELFAARQVSKTYFARAHAGPGATVSNRIIKHAGDLRAQVVPGIPNAHTIIRPLDSDEGMFELHPRTGRTHQLRLHLAGLGNPIQNDPLYPTVDREALGRGDDGDYTQPLRLLAARVQFTDPFTGRQREFASLRTL